MSATSDRSWMYRMKDDQGYFCREYAKKLVEFLDFAYSNEECVAKIRLEDGSVSLQIRCPCKQCNNARFRDRETVSIHLCKKGFMMGYTIWDQHGETARQEEPIEGCSYRMNEDLDAIDGYTRMVMDNMHQPCIGVPTWNFNQFEAGTQNLEAPIVDSQRLNEMLRDADTPLWEGCQDWSKLEAATRLLSLKSECNMSEVTYNKVLKTFKSMLPSDNQLPDSFYETKKSLKPMMLESMKIHACKNHCMLFFNEYEELNNCLWCHESRYKNNERRIPHLVLTYLPIAPRLQRLYMTKHMAKQMTWHADHNRKPGVMVHPSDGEAWKHFDDTHPDFAREIRNVRLGLCTDGFNPNSSNSSPHSTWPVFLTVYNLPPWISFKSSSIHLTLVIPGKKNPGQNLDVFLKPLIEELKYLYVHGVITRDAYRGTDFCLRAVLLWTISDFPAYAMLSGWSTHGKLACPYCMGDSKAFQLQHGGKPCWFDCHRQFLDDNHLFRRDKKSFTRNKVMACGPPPLLTGHEILEQVRQLPTVYEGNPYRPKDRKPPGFGQSHNWVKRSIFWELPYWPELLIRHNLDVMHIEKNVFENLFHTVMDTSKTKDNAKARKDVEKYCYRPELHMFVGRNNKLMKPKATYALTKTQLSSVCRWLKKDVKFPDGYASNIGSCVNVEDSTFYGFKSHDCHVFMQRLLPIALKGMIPYQIWDVITELCLFFRVLCQRELHMEDLLKLQRSVVVSLCKLEKIFPPSFFDSMEHLVIHLTHEAMLGGPVQYRWMYQFERKLGSLKRTIRNKARIEGSIVEAYLIDEVSTFCELYYGPNVETRHNREPRNFAAEVPGDDSRLRIFKVPGRGLSNKSRKTKALTQVEMEKIHLYILLNCPEVQPLVAKFEEYAFSSQLVHNQQDIEKCKEENFTSWFTYAVENDMFPDTNHLKVLARHPLRYYVPYDGYFVNGYKFHTKKRAQGRVTQNTGVCVKGSCYNDEEQDYYGELESIYEVEYGLVGLNVVLFKCRWFNPVNAVRVDKHGLVEVKMKSYGYPDDPFVLASQCSQVYYMPYPSTNISKSWCAVVKTKPRAVYEVGQDQTYGNDDESFFQEHERIQSQTAEVNSTIYLVDTDAAVEVNDDEDVNEDDNDESESEEEFEDDADPSEDEEEFQDDDEESEGDEHDESEDSE